MINRIKLAMLAISIVLFTAILLYAPPSWAQLQDSPTALVDEVWQLLNRDYVDPSFNHQDWQAVRQNYLSQTYTSQAQAYTAIQEMVASLEDRYTVFLTPSAYEKLTLHSSGKLTGVGLELAENQQTRALTVVKRLQGSPAFVAGIQPQDVIVAIDGQPTTGMALADVVRRILGPAGTWIELTVQRQGQELGFKLLRTEIILHPVSYHALTTESGKIGYIHLPEFTATAPEEMRQAIAALQAEAVQGYLLDLRSNPGGLLDACLEIADLWLDRGTIVSLNRREGTSETYRAEATVLTQQPLVLLINGSSASASEILAAALQEQGRAILVGTPSFGKGLVQTVYRLTDGSGLKVTSARYYTPAGNNIHGIGVQPDLEVALTDTERQSLQQHHSFGTTADPQVVRATQELSRLIQTAALAADKAQV